MRLYILNSTTQLSTCLMESSLIPEPFKCRQVDMLFWISISQAKPQNRIETTQQ